MGRRVPQDDVVQTTPPRILATFRLGHDRNGYTPRPHGTSVRPPLVPCGRSTSAGARLRARRCGHPCDMARPLWSGSVSFGLVNIPVRMFSAEHDHTVSFHQLNKKNGHRIKYRKVDAETGREVSADDIVRGFEVHDGSWITFTDDEFDDLKPNATKSLDIEDFVDLADIDPIYYERTYYLAPDDNVSAKRAYRLLHDAMEKSGRAGIGTVVMHSKQYLAAIRPMGKILAVSMMRFADEVVDPASIEDLHLDAVQVDAKAAKMAASLVDSLAGTFDPSKYRDTYTAELRDAIDRKAKGETIEVDEPAPTAKVVDLMEALQASLAGAKGGGRRAAKGASGTRAAAKPAGAKRSAAKQPAAKRPAAKRPAAKRSGASARPRKRAAA
jgi:DNA end-binding protein Ku